MLVLHFIRIETDFLYYIMCYTCQISQITTCSVRFLTNHNNIFIISIFSQRSSHWLPFGLFSLMFLLGKTCNQLNILPPTQTVLWKNICPYGTLVKDSSFQIFFDNYSIMLTASGWEQSPLSCLANKPLPCLGLVTDGSLWEPSRSALLQKMSFLTHPWVWFPTRHMLMTVHFNTAYVVADILYSESNANVVLRKTH